MSTDYGVGNKYYFNKDSEVKSKFAKDFLTKKHVVKYGMFAHLPYRIFKDNVVTKSPFLDKEVNRIKVVKGTLKISKLEKIINDPKNEKNKNLLKTIGKVLLLASGTIAGVSWDLISLGMDTLIYSILEGYRVPFIGEMQIINLNRALNKHSDIEYLTKGNTKEKINEILNKKLEELKAIKANIRIIIPDKSDGRYAFEQNIDKSIENIELFLKKHFSVNEEDLTTNEKEVYDSIKTEKLTPHHEIYNRIEKILFKDLDDSNSNERIDLERDIVQAVLNNFDENIDLLIKYQSRKPQNQNSIFLLINKMKEHQLEKLENLLIHCTQISNDPFFVNEYRNYLKLHSENSNAFENRMKAIEES